MKIDTLFFKFLVVFSILLMMALVRKNIKELFQATTSDETTGKLVASIHDSDKTEDSYNVTLNWTIDPTLKVDYYIFSKLDHGTGSVLEETTYEFVNNMVKDINTYKINNLDYTKGYKLGLSCYNSETGTGNIVRSYMTGFIKETKPEGKSEQQLLQQVSKNQVSCNPDGSYVITNNCRNNIPINSNYTKTKYEELNEYLTRVTKYTSE
jgi:hypothetical protein